MPTDSTSAIDESTRLDLNLDAINCLRLDGKLAVDDIVVGGRMRQWREHSAADGESFLRQSAANGDFSAMEALGLRLFNGEALPKSTTDGLAWLTKAAELGSSTAMVCLAECLLEESSSDRRLEAQTWLREAMEQGSTSAAITLGSRLMLGIGLIADPTQGQQILVNAARGGSQLAHIRLGASLLSGRGVSADQEAGLRWLRRIGAEAAQHFSNMAYYAYSRSLAAATQQTARIFAEDAASLFNEAIRQGNAAEAVNLAYLLRRGEIDRAQYPPIEKLLVSHVNQEVPASLINQALRVARGIDCTADWHVADILVSKIKDSSAILSWWSVLGQEGDAEGHLVTGWLTRHRLAIDPEQIPLEHRLDYARSGGWSVPPWMNQPVSAGN